MINIQVSSMVGNSDQPKFNLQERTILFSKSILTFCGKIPHTSVNRPVIDQLIRSATSIGANYHEATEGSSKKDFTNKIFIAKKEAKETQYWIQLLAHITPEYITEARILWKEARELTLILAAAGRTSRNSHKIDKIDA